jgi:RHH-type rel operon transcriptional repressor/antitoxin RelB
LSTQSKKILKEKQMKPAINIRLEKEMLNSLDNYARELEKTRTNLIEKAIDAYFDKLDEMVADKRIDALKKGETEVIPLEIVFARAGIDV